MKFLAFIIAIACGSLLLFATADFPAWGDPDSPANSYLSPYYIQNSVKDTKVPNLVTSVLADYRGFDTMFETTVIFCAGLACFLLLRNYKKKEESFYRHIPTGVIIQFKNADKSLPSGKEFEHMDAEWVPHDIIIQTVCRVLIPFIQLYALYVIAHGDFSPGGGFQGGVIFGSSLILYAIAYNLRALVKRIKERLLGIFSATGVLIYSGIAFICMVLGGNFLDYGKLKLILPGDPEHVRALGMLGVEIGVGLAVMAVMIIIYVNIVSEGRHDEGL